MPVTADFRALRSSAAIATLVVGTLALAACSSGSAAPQTTGSSEDPIEITYIHRLPDGDGMTKVADLAAEWNAANPDIQVTTTKFDGGSAELFTKLETDVNAGSAACLAQLDYSEIPTAYVKGLTEDVSKYAEQYKSNFSGSYSLMQVNGTTVGLPQDTGPLAYYYNKAAFESLGLSVPTTLAEFETTAAKAAESGKYIAAFEPDEAKFWFSGQAATAGGTWYAADDGKWTVTVESPESTVVADFWQKLLDTKSTLVAERWGDSFPAALNDQTLIGTIGAAWEAPLLADAMAGTVNEGQWAVTQMPDYGAGAITGADGGSGVVVAKGCEYPEQSVKFLSWFNTQIDALVSQGLVVAAKGDMTTPDAIKAFYGGQDVFAELATANANLTSEFPYMPFFTTVGDAMTQAAAAAGSGTGKVSDIFTAAQEQSIASLKDAGLSVNE